MDKDTIEFYAKAIYEDNLEFLEGVKPKNVQKPMKYHCFRTPED